MPSTASPSWLRSRYGFALFFFVSLLAGWFVLRLILLRSFIAGSLHAPNAVEVCLSGFQCDCFAALVLTLPMLVWMLIIPERWLIAPWHGRLFFGVMFLVGFIGVFLLFVEYFFFEEFRSRFNTVAVDYLLYPQEVFVNIWQSYHVGLFLGICAVLTLAWLFAASRLFSRMWERAFSAWTRLGYLIITVALAALLVPTTNLKGARVSTDRTLNEIANNGGISFVVALFTRHLDYGAFYKTLPADEAYQRARRLLAEPNSQFLEDGKSIRRRVEGNTNAPRLNVVIFLEESLGSEFWGCLGRTNSLTPEMDRLALEEGLLFTNLFACGNRTVRGMEGVLSSFPPLPGDSIVRRDRSENVETVARVLKRDGYATIFFYGGRGFFDGMRSFTVANGYDRFIEQKHFEHPTFTTIWGVCDEDIFQKAIQECRTLSQSSQPFCATILSVSNHKPFTYPKGRIKENPDEQRRENAVKYSDYALGEFFRAAKKEAFWTNTVFAVVADHGARVYGEQSIPIHSYEIPLVILGPAVIRTPAQLGQAGGSLDVAPTILGLIGRPYDTLFFGRDLLRTRPEGGRALLNHNRDIGLLAHNRLVVLGLKESLEYYAGDPKRVDMKPLRTPTADDLELAKDTIAIYQVADDLYTHYRYRLDAK